MEDATASRTAGAGSWPLVSPFQKEPALLANTSPQAILICNTKLRPLADRCGQFYNLCKALQAEALAENWVGMFPADGTTIADGADVDGRAIITNTDINSFITFIAAQITAYEATSFANRNLVLKIAVNPERI